MTADAVEQLGCAMRGVIDGLNEFARRLGEVFGSIGNAIMHAFGLVDERAEHIARYGPRNVDGEGVWQSDLCAAWLHGSCPSPVWCECTCHGGSVR